MAQIAEDEIELGTDEVLVEKKIIPARHKRASPLALILLLAFVGTWGLVVFGDRLGLRESTPPPATQATIPAPQTPAP
jgi:hypothetical protein